MTYFTTIVGLTRKSLPNLERRFTQALMIQGKFRAVQQRPQHITQHLLSLLVVGSSRQLLQHDLALRRFRVPRQCRQIQRFKPLFVREERRRERFEQPAGRHVGGIVDYFSMHHRQRLRYPRLVIGHPAWRYAKLLDECVPRPLS